MAYRVELSQHAFASLQNIDRYLRQRSPGGADNVRREIEYTLGLLADFPMTGTKLPPKDVRYTVTRKYRYRIVFRPINGVVQVLKIDHPRQRTAELS